MDTYFINHDEVNSEIQRLRSRLSANAINPVNAEYRQFISLMGETDGAANAMYLEAIEANRKKTVMACEAMERLLTFLADATKQIQIRDNQLARIFTKTRP